MDRAAGVLFHFQAVEENLGHRFAVTTLPWPRSRQQLHLPSVRATASPCSMRADMGRVRMDRRADEAIAVIADRDHRALDHGEQCRHRRMAVADRLNVVPRPIDAGMDLRLRRAGLVAVEHLAVEIDDQNVVGGDAGAACVARRDQKTIGAGQPRADMAAVIKQFGHDHHAGARRRAAPATFLHLRTLLIDPYATPSDGLSAF